MLSYVKPYSGWITAACYASTRCVCACSWLKKKRANVPPSSCSPRPLPFSAPQGTQGHEKGHQSSNGWRRGPIPLVRGPRVHRCSEGGGSEMEAGVGRGQRGGQRCTSCMLGNAALFFPPLPLPPSLPHLHSSAYFFFLMQVWLRTPYVRAHTRADMRAHGPLSHLLLSPVLIHSSKLFSIFLISFSLNLSLTRSFTHLFTHAYLHLFHFRSLSLSLSLFLLTAPHTHTHPHPRQPPSLIPPLAPSSLVPRSHL